jgi:hypothetical protein
MASNLLRLATLTNPLRAVPFFRPPAATLPASLSPCPRHEGHWRRLVFSRGIPITRGLYCCRLTSTTTCRHLRNNRTSTTTTATTTRLFLLKKHVSRAGEFSLYKVKSRRDLVLYERMVVFPILTRRQRRPRLVPYLYASDLNYFPTARGQIFAAG